MAISPLNTVRLIRIERDGALLEAPEISGQAREMCRAGAEYFEKSGYQVPWVGYIAFEGDVSIGTCAFKTPPKDGTVEISYHTFPGFEGKGFATTMVQRLVEISRATDPSVVISAQTLPEKNASTRVLTKASFIHVGDIVHPEDGIVWEWRLL